MAIDIILSAKEMGFSLDELEEISYITFWKMCFRWFGNPIPSRQEKKALVRIATQADMDRL